MSDQPNVTANANVDAAKAGVAAVTEKAREAGFMIDVLIDQRNQALNLAANMQTKANMLNEELIATKFQLRASNSIAEAQKNDLTLRAQENMNLSNKLVEANKQIELATQGHSHKTDLLLSTEETLARVESEKSSVVQQCEWLDGEVTRLSNEVTSLKRIIEKHGIPADGIAKAANKGKKKPMAKAKPRAQVTLKPEVKAKREDVMRAKLPKITADML